MPRARRRRSRRRRRKARPQTTTPTTSPWPSPSTSTRRWPLSSRSLRRGRRRSSSSRCLRRTRPRLPVSTAPTTSHRHGGAPLSKRSTATPSATTSTPATSKTRTPGSSTSSTAPPAASQISEESIKSETTSPSIDPFHSIPFHGGFDDGRSTNDEEERRASDERTRASISSRTESDRSPTSPPLLSSLLLCSPLVSLERKVPLPGLGLVAFLKPLNQAIKLSNSKQGLGLFTNK
mmetsp:Transcript_37282/g.119591  ORF Transcript_37282/g.119591 Transcript_37282/m.119591 type:complete len:235 (-) Transcript_37282:42-746(-)